VNDLLDSQVTCNCGCRAEQVAVIREGASDAAALLGIIRLAEFLARPEQLGMDRSCQIFVDSGTGVTATGEDRLSHDHLLSVSSRA